MYRSRTRPPARRNGGRSHAEAERETASTRDTVGQQVHPYLKHQANRKEKAHGAAVRKKGHEFQPFIMSTKGQFGPGVKDVVNAIAGAAVKAMPVDWEEPGEFVGHFKTTIAYQLHRGISNHITYATRILLERRQKPWLFVKPRRQRRRRRGRGRGREEAKEEVGSVEEEEEAGEERRRRRGREEEKEEGEITAEEEVEGMVDAEED